MLRDVCGVRARGCVLTDSSLHNVLCLCIHKLQMTVFAVETITQAVS